MSSTLTHDAAEGTKSIFGFWLYILSDCVLFSVLFVSYLVLKNNVAGQPPLGHLISLPDVLKETMALLCSSFTYGLAMFALYRGRSGQLIFWLLITFALGASFIAMELSEFAHLCAEGYSWKTSAALSAFFTLVGTHGLHVGIGLLFIAIMCIQVLVFGSKKPFIHKRLTILGIFWHFLDIVWIFVFTIVYLIGTVS